MENHYLPSNTPKQLSSASTESESQKQAGESIFSNKVKEAINLVLPKRAYVVPILLPGGEHLPVVAGFGTYGGEAYSKPLERISFIDAQLLQYLGALDKEKLDSMPIPRIAAELNRAISKNRPFKPIMTQEDVEQLYGASSPNEEAKKCIKEMNQCRDINSREIEHIIRECYGGSIYRLEDLGFSTARIAGERNLLRRANGIHIGYVYESPSLFLEKSQDVKVDLIETAAYGLGNESQNLHIQYIKQGEEILRKSSGANIQSIGTVKQIGNAHQDFTASRFGPIWKPIEPAENITVGTIGVVSDTSFYGMTKGNIGSIGEIVSGRFAAQSKQVSIGTIHKVHDWAEGKHAVVGESSQGLEVKVVYNAGDQFGTKSQGANIGIIHKADYALGEDSIDMTIESVLDPGSSALKGSQDGYVGEIGRSWADIGKNSRGLIIGQTKENVEVAPGVDMYERISEAPKHPVRRRARPSREHYESSEKLTERRPRRRRTTEQPKEKKKLPGFFGRLLGK